MNLVQFDHTFTPNQAFGLLSRIPADSYHWVDIGGRGRAWPIGLEPKTRLELYTRLMASGEWHEELSPSDHPVRWDEKGEITHGVLRLQACVDAGQPFRSAVECPPWFREQLAACSTKRLQTA